MAMASERGIGVADMTSTSGAGSRSARASRWRTPKRCCSSTTQESERVELERPFLDERVGADHDARSRRRPPARGPRRGGAGWPKPVTSSTTAGQPGQELANARRVLLGEELGGRHERGLVTRPRRPAAWRRARPASWPQPTSPWSIRFMPARRGQCRRRSRAGQRIWAPVRVKGRPCVERADEDGWCARTRCRDRASVTWWRTRAWRSWRKKSSS